MRKIYKYLGIGTGITLLSIATAFPSILSYKQISEIKQEKQEIIQHTNEIIAKQKELEQKYIYIITNCEAEKIAREKEIKELSDFLKQNIDKLDSKILQIIKNQNEINSAENLLNTSQESIITSLLKDKESLKKKISDLETRIDEKPKEKPESEKLEPFFKIEPSAYCPHTNRGATRELTQAEFENLLRANTKFREDYFNGMKKVIKDSQLRDDTTKPGITFDLKNIYRLVKYNELKLRHYDKVYALRILDILKQNFMPKGGWTFKDSNGRLRQGPRSYAFLEDYIRNKKGDINQEQILKEIENFTYKVSFIPGRRIDFQISVYDNSDCVKSFSHNISESREFGGNAEEVMLKVLKVAGYEYPEE